MPQFRRLVWDPQYTVHDETLDAQHQELFRITNNLLDLYEQGSVALYPSLQDLVDYVSTHFRSENAVMAASDYPDYAEQHAQHDEFLDKMREFINSYQESDKGLTYTMLSYLHEWIDSHTLRMDLKYGQHLVRRRMKNRHNG